MEYLTPVFGIRNCIFSPAQTPFAGAIALLLAYTIFGASKRRPGTFVKSVATSIPKPRTIGDRLCAICSAKLMIFSFRMSVDVAAILIIARVWFSVHFLLMT